MKELFNYTKGSKEFKDKNWNILLDFVITKKSQLMDDSKTSVTVTTIKTASSTLTMINTRAVFYHQGKKIDSKNTINIRMYSNL